MTDSAEKLARQVRMAAGPHDDRDKAVTQIVRDMTDRIERLEPEDGKMETTMQSESVNEIAAALAKAQGMLEAAKKGSENPHFRSKYADLGECWYACRHALTSNQIAVLQRVTGDVLRTTLVHSSGQWMSDEGVPLLGYRGTKNEMQGLGSAVTYARRYGLCAMVGIAPEDDDGNALTRDKAPEPQEQRQPPPPIPAPENMPEDLCNQDGTVSRTKIKEWARDFVRQVHACSDTDELDVYVDSERVVLECIRENLPTWWQGANGTEGLKDHIENQRKALSQEAA